jgi:hypothetical protein
MGAKINHLRPRNTWYISIQTGYTVARIEAHIQSPADTKLESTVQGGIQIKHYNGRIPTKLK